MLKRPVTGFLTVSSQSMRQSRNAFMDAYRIKRTSMGFNDALKHVAHYLVCNPIDEDLGERGWADDFEQWLCEQSATAEQHYTAALRTMNDIVHEHGDFTTISTREYDDLRAALQDQNVARNLEYAAHESGKSASKRARNMASAGATFHANMDAARKLFLEPPASAARAKSMTK